MSSTSRSLVQKFFITFPQSGLVTKEKFFSIINQSFPLERSIIAEEQHADGQPHLHALCHFTVKVTKTNLLTFFKSKYPDAFQRINVQAVRSWKKATEYLTIPEKDKYVDPDPLVQGFSLAFRAKRTFSEVEADHRQGNQEFSDFLEAYEAKQEVLSNALFKAHIINAYREAREVELHEANRQGSFIASLCESNEATSNSQRAPAELSQSH